MVAQKGRELLIKQGDAASPEVFTTIGGARDTTLTLNEVEVDTTSKDDSGVRQLLSGSILKSMSLSGNGVFKDDSAFDTFRENYEVGTHGNLQIVIPGTSTAAGTYEGAFRITQLELTGAHDGAVEYSFSVESDGTIAFTDAT
jgi:TP901-1 family phage major tail protein